MNEIVGPRRLRITKHEFDKTFTRKPYKNPLEDSVIKLEQLVSKLEKRLNELNF